MTTTPRTAPTSAARKRQAERRELLHSEIGSQPVTFQGTEQLPVLPDTSGWVKRAPGDVIEAGTPCVFINEPGGPFEVHFGGLHHEVTVHEDGPFWTPPPAPREPWRVISTDRDQPTDAYVNGVPGRYWLEGANVHVLDANGDDCWVCTSEAVTEVELLDTHDPVTHVPVERALIDEAARLVEWWNTDSFAPPPRSGDRTAAEILTELAALADGAQS